MSNNVETVANVAAKKAQNAIQRLSTLEENLKKLAQAQNNLAKGASNAVGTLQQQFTHYVSIVDAIVAILGEDVVTTKVQDIARERAQESADAQKAQVAALVEQGILKVADTITEKSLFVGKTIDPKGEVVHPGRQQALVQALSPDLKEKLLLQSVGFQLDTGEGAKFEVTEIYEVVEKKAEEAPAAEAPEEAAPGTGAAAPADLAEAPTPDSGGSTGEAQ